MMAMLPHQWTNMLTETTMTLLSLSLNSMPHVAFFLMKLELWSYENPPTYVLNVWVYFIPFGRCVAHECTWDLSVLLPGIVVL